VLVGGVTLAVFLPGLFGDFLAWDDDRNFLGNPAYRGLGASRIAWMFTTFHMGHYKPLTWLTHGLDYTLWGMEPFGAHLTSIVLHATAAVAVLLLARRLLRTALPPTVGDPAVRFGAAGAALLFSAHPLRVEPVTWLTGRGDVLAGLLAMLCLLAYLRAHEPTAAADGRSMRWYWVSVLLFAMALLAKAMVLTLPVVLLILDVYPLRRLDAGSGAVARVVWLEKIPFLALGALAGAVALLARLDFGSILELSEVGVLERAGAVAYGLAFYLWKTIAPAHLSPLYEFAAVMRGGPWPFVVSAAIVTALSLLAVGWRRRWPWLAAVWATYVVTLLPVSGILQNGPQITADRYSYLACLGWTLLAGAALSRCAEAWRSRASGRWVPASGVAITLIAVLTLGALSAWQTLVWQDTLTLWSRAVELQPASAVSQSGLGMALLAEGEPAAAARHFEEALRLAPAFAEARMGLAFTRALAGRDEEAVAHGREAVSRSRRDARFRVALAEILNRQGRHAEALAALEEAMHLEPRSPTVRFASAVTLARLGRPEPALAALEEGRRLARAAGLAEREGDRVAALVYTPFDPARAAAAWQRYLAAMSEVRHPTPQEARAIFRGLLALDALRDRAARP
jgi:tetratricopeptide (TPR) repeat protein